MFDTDTSIVLTLPSGFSWLLQPGSVRVRHNRVEAKSTVKPKISLAGDVVQLSLVSASLDLSLEMNPQEARLFAYDILRMTDGKRE